MKTVIAAVLIAAAMPALAAMPARPAADTARDAARKPAVMVSFAGIKPGSKVADFIPGGGYFTRVFAEAVGPSGHVTALVVVLSLAVVAAGWAAWAVLVAVAVCLLGVFSIACTFHYFTDTIGALLLGTAVMCVAVLSAGLAPSHPASPSDDPALQR